MNVEKRRILIIGGYGTFGGRVAQLLADDERAILLIAGRSKTSAEQFCARHRRKAEMTPCTFDRTGDLAAQLAALSPDIVLDAAGPFQSYGADPYALVRAVVAQGAHYLDLADASDFVRGIAQFDNSARARGVSVLSGVSSFPVLNAAVVRAMLKPGDIPLEMSGGIVPSPHAEIGPNVMRAVASYAGKTISITREGSTGEALALIETRDMTVATPGALPVGRKRFTLVDVPELVLFRDLWPGVRDVWVGVGMSPQWLQRMLNVVARLVRHRLLPSILPFAPLMLRVQALLARGEHRGGMVIRVRGDNRETGPFARSWHMTAEGDDGPMVPSMPAAIIIARVLEGTPPNPGARAALQELELPAYDRTFEPRRIRYGFRDDMAGAHGPLYRRVLACAFESLSPALQAMHDRQGDKIACGVAQIDRGVGLLSRIAAAIVGFPPGGRGVPVKVSFVVSNGVEIWQRDFGGRKFQSAQREGTGRNAGLITEAFGPASFGLAYEITGGRGNLVLRKWQFMGVPMPM